MSYKILLIYATCLYERMLWPQEYYFMSLNLTRLPLWQRWPKLSLNIDLHQVYNFMCCDFPLKLLEAYSFLTIIIGWIRECIYSQHYLISLGVKDIGFFSSAKGLRLWCMMAPYLFIMDMQYLFDFLSYKMEARHLMGICSSWLHKHCSTWLLLI